MRVHELAKELDVPSKDLLEELRAMGFEPKSHMSTLTKRETDKARENYGAETPAATTTETTVSEETDERDTRESAEERVAEPLTPPAKPDLNPEPDQIPEPVEVVDEVDEVEATTEIPAQEKEKPEEINKNIVVKGPVVVRELADMLHLKPNQLVADLMGMNVFASINETLHVKLAQRLAEKHGFRLTLEKKKVEKKPPTKKVEAPKEPEEDKPDQLKIRAPIVTLLGHVDHGKTTLLDTIRKSKVATREDGGITQHIGAYMVEANGQHITFLDTPGHAAFTAMRARGANLTDIVVLVIAANDGLMPQTKEAIQHAKAADVTIMVAINKIDLPSANPDRVKQQLQSEGLAPEDWGGDLICCPVCATTGEGVDHLLEMIGLQSEILELQANPNRTGEGFVIDAQLEPGMGPTANLLVRRGTLKVGNAIACGQHWGRIKALINDQGKNVKAAGPSVPVKCLGLTSVPEAGARFRVYKNPKEAREVAETMLAENRQQSLQGPEREVSLDELLRQTDPNSAAKFPIILKTDVQGSTEALLHALGEINSDKVDLHFVLKGVGNITTNDVLLAGASDAIIFGFHVGKENGVNALAKREGVEIRTYEIIYELIDNVRDAMTGMLEPEKKETVTGQAEVLQIFELGKRARIAGCLVKSGRVSEHARARVLRNDNVIYEGKMASLKRYQNNAREVREGQECGIGLDDFNGYEVGDVIVAYLVESVAAHL